MTKVVWWSTVLRCVVRSLSSVPKKNQHENLISCSWFADRPVEYVVAVSCAGFSMFGSCFCFLSFKRSVKEVSKSIELDSSGGTHVNVCCCL